jgi:hypothetical protein
MWMRSSQVVRASGCQCQSRNSPGFIPSILRHSEIWGAADEAVLNDVLYKKNPKNSPFKTKFGSTLFRLDFFASFCLFPFVFASDFFLVKKFFCSFSFHFDFFASFRLFHVRFRFRFLLFRIDVKQAKSHLFFASKGYEIFASISIFASEAKTRAHPTSERCRVGPLSFIPIYA